MSLTDNLDKVAFTSSLLVDKIADTLTGTFTVNNNTTTSETVAHDLNKKCFSELQWSIDGDNYYGSSAVINVGGGEIVCTQAVDTGSVTFYADNYNTGSNYTIRYRLMLLWPT